MRTYGNMDVREARLELQRRRQRRPVVWIHAQKEIGLVISAYSQIVLDHLADHLVFPPQRHEYSDAFSGSARQLQLGGEMEAALAKTGCNGPSIEVYQVDKKIGQAAQ